MLITKYSNLRLVSSCQVCHEDQSSKLWKNSKGRNLSFRPCYMFIIDTFTFIVNTLEYMSYFLVFFSQSVYHLCSQTKNCTRFKQQPQHLFLRLVLHQFCSRSLINYLAQNERICAG